MGGCSVQLATIALAVSLVFSVGGICLGLSISTGEQALSDTEDAARLALRDTEAAGKRALNDTNLACNQGISSLVASGMANVEQIGKVQMMRAQVDAVVNKFDGYLSYPKRLVQQISKQLGGLDRDWVVENAPDGFLRTTGRQILYQAFRDAARHGVSELGVRVKQRGYNRTGGAAGATVEQSQPLLHFSEDPRTSGNPVGGTHIYYALENFLAGRETSSYGLEQLVFGTTNDEGYIVDRGQSRITEFREPVVNPTTKKVNSYGLSSEPKNAGKKCKTTDGQECHFPFSFEYGGYMSSLPGGAVNFTKCTTSGWDRPWCATKPNILVTSGSLGTAKEDACEESTGPRNDKRAGDWANCEEGADSGCSMETSVDGPCTTTAGEECIFPFVYRQMNPTADGFAGAVEYNGCTQIDQPGIHAWCATSVKRKRIDYDYDGSYYYYDDTAVYYDNYLDGWGECSEACPVDVLSPTEADKATKCLTTEGVECSFPFTNFGFQESACTVLYGSSDAWWCPTTQSDIESYNFGTCDSTSNCNADFCDLSAPFNTNGQSHSGKCKVPAAFASWDITSHEYGAPASTARWAPLEPHMWMLGLPVVSQWRDRAFDPAARRGSPSDGPCKTMAGEECIFPFKVPEKIDCADGGDDVKINTHTGCTTKQYPHMMRLANDPVPLNGEGYIKGWPWCATKMYPDNATTSDDESQFWWQDPDKCLDVEGFLDETGYPCYDWVGYNCQTASADWGISAQAQVDVIENCPLSCGLCQPVTTPQGWGYCVPDTNCEEEEQTRLGTVFAVVDVAQLSRFVQDLVPPNSTSRMYAVQTNPWSLQQGMLAAVSRGNAFRPGVVGKASRATDAFYEQFGVSFKVGMQVTEAADDVIRAHGEYAMGQAGQYDSQTVLDATCWCQTCRPALDADDKLNNGCAASCPSGQVCGSVLYWVRTQVVEDDAELRMHIILLVNKEVALQEITASRERVLTNIDDERAQVAAASAAERARVDAATRANEEKVSDDKAKSYTIMYIVVVVVSLVLLAVGVGLACAIVAPLHALEVDMDMVARMDLDGVDAEQKLSWLAEVMRMQKSFLMMLKCMKAYRAYMPQTLLDTLAGDEEEEEEEELQRKESKASTGDNKSRQTKGQSTMASTKMTNKKSLDTVQKQVQSTAKWGRKKISVVAINVKNWHAHFHCMGQLPATQAHADTLTVLLQIYQSCRATPDTFCGDRIVATLNTVKQCGQHAVQAAKIGLTAKDDVAKVKNPKPQTLPVGVPEYMQISCGIASGAADVGTMGSTAMRRMSFISPVFTYAVALERVARKYDVPVLAHHELQTMSKSSYYYRLADNVSFPKLTKKTMFVWQLMMAAAAGEEEWMYQLDNAQKGDPFGEINDNLAQFWAKGEPVVDAEKLAESAPGVAQRLQAAAAGPKQDGAPAPLVIEFH